MRLVVDANILIGELLRKRGRELIKNPDLDLYISQRVFSEANHELSKRIKVMVEKGKFEFYLGEIILKEAKLIIDNFITTIPLADYQHLEKEAVNRIPRDPDDWETVAISLLLDVDIWTKDSDFFGCGRATWTTETLIYYLNKHKPNS
jgi:predicted nucleic acid-binding protein